MARDSFQNAQDSRRMSGTQKVANPFAQFRGLAAGIGTNAEATERLQWRSGGALTPPDLSEHLT